MSFASASSAREPMGQINATPLIDVLLVLLVVLVMTVPIATNTFEVDLPGPPPIIDRNPDPVRNLLVVETDGGLRWNGRPIEDGELAGQLAQVRAMKPEPEVQFRPEAEASYDRTARVLLIVKQSRITRFGFVDNEKYRVFDSR